MVMHVRQISFLCFSVKYVSIYAHAWFEIDFCFFGLVYPVSASMESIEKDYVIVNAYFASMDAFSFYFETSVQDKSTTRVSICPSGKSDKDIAVEMQTMELADSSVGAAQSHGSDLLVTSSASSIIREVQGLTILHPLTRLHLLYHYVQALAELSQEKVN